MGTTAEWMRVLGLGAAYGILALTWEAIKSGSRREFVEAAPGWLVVAVLWAMMMVFEWRVLHGFVGAVFAILLVGLFVLGFAQRRARKQIDVSSKAH